jgi:hypothetical protein
MFLRNLILAAIVLCVATPALAGKPIEDLVDVPVPGDLAGNGRSIEDVKQAIIDGCRTKGWRPQIVNDNEMKCSILVRSRHYAEVRIPYSAEKYSILYADSKELDYDPETRKIHRNYNRWVVNLSQAIQNSLPP